LEHRLKGSVSDAKAAFESGNKGRGAAGGERYQTPDSVLEGWPKEFDDVTEEIYADFNKKHGTNFKFQLKK